VQADRQTVAYQKECRMKPTTFSIVLLIGIETFKRRRTAEAD